MNLPPEISNLLTGQRLIENALGLNKPQPTKPMIESLKIDSPTEEGYYTAKRKTWAVGSQLTIVRVARPNRWRVSRLSVRRRNALVRRSMGLV
jgi:hypothetical protein